MIYKYDDFLFKNIINESILYYSPKVRNILNNIDDPIAKDLATLETTDLPIDVTFVDLDENKEGYLTFTTMKSAEKYLLSLGQETTDFLKGTSSNPNYIYNPDGAKSGSDNMAVSKIGPYRNSRNPIKLGKFVNNLLPNKYSEKERELFVNKFKSKLEAIGEKFILVEGEDINYYYWHENYKQDGGSLNSSCMRDEKNIFELYVNNPEVCKLLVLLEDELVIGRALIWKLNSITDDIAEYFMDRQYFVKEYDVEKFREYARKEGWAYKDENKHGYSDIVYNGKLYDAYMEVQLKRIHYEYFPYMDTFRSFDHNNCILINDSIDEREYYILDGTSGEYTNNSMVWSDYEQQEIDRDEAIWSEPLDSWINDYDSVEVERASSYRYKGWYPSDHKNITYDGWNEEYICDDDSLYSDEYEYSLYEDDAVSVISEIEEDGTVSDDSYYMHRNDEDIIRISDLEDSNWYGKLFLKSKWLGESDWDKNWNNHTHIKRILLSEDYKGELVPDVFLVDVYKIDKTLNLFKNNDSITDQFIESFKNINMLSEEDAIIFGFNVISYDEKENKDIRGSFRMDKWTYDDYIEPIKKFLINELKDKIKLEDTNDEYTKRLEELEKEEAED